MAEEIIILENVQKDYRLGGNIIRALIDINTKINLGEFVMIMGPTGCGKTTLLNVMSGLEIPDQGRVIFDGDNIERAPEAKLAAIRRQKIGFVFQDFNLIENLTAIENVESVLWPLGLASKKIEDRALHALRRVDLLDRKDHYPRDLSGGERQRVAIARAIINQPRVLFADEPTGNLDEKSGIQIMELLKELNKDLETTLIMVTHDSNLTKYSSRIIRMESGRIVKTGQGK